MLRDSRDIIKRLKDDGFHLVSTRGSHHKFRHPQTRRIVIVAHPRKDIPAGTVRSIYDQAGWPKD
ncbi:Predicted RNA binding protein YcfA, dsRBD-like fold, HicA-like mRNA interferase family [Mesorhizobium albiziae]|uniref:Predicted RNA binding protein YcfA, dsRBD-like fold, HicA-like mRNA interferase family n=1 Tax=Neomesorhizobium albiziae TaxID=335020 RepID=A0A1I4BHZ0_9HYPH|nr:type II toxin-antitoxin system HicA family toxin [Mesorhizobium albiziae]GLS29878.1 toxin HicA [Mesorhizobium albiziae]SFK67920.1 Predicted RNA binding protein YcfA, dsRBD-like fold, HicA-like mRNA interferase family [Mesorhizobium albiziae]